MPNMSAKEGFSCRAYAILLRLTILCHESSANHGGKLHCSPQLAPIYLMSLETHYLFYQPLVYQFPYWMIWLTTVATRFDGMAKPTPLAGVFDSVLMAASVGMPTSSPCKSIRAPPLLPGLMAASVWTAWEMVAPVDSVTLRFSALTMPLVAVSVIPSGLPIARTSWPTVSFDESPIWATVIWANGGIRTTARSLAGEVPTSCPCNVVPVLRTTSIVCAPLTTWLLVTMSPLVSIMTPEPIC